MLSDFVFCFMYESSIRISFLLFFLKVKRGFTSGYRYWLGYQPLFLSEKITLKYGQRMNRQKNYVFSFHSVSIDYSYGLLFDLYMAHTDISNGKLFLNRAPLLSHKISENTILIFFYRNSIFFTYTLYFFHQLDAKNKHFYNDFENYVTISSDQIPKVVTHIKDMI